MNLLKSLGFVGLLSTLVSGAFAQDYNKFAGNFSKGVTVKCSDATRVGQGGETLNWKMEGGSLKGTASGEEWSIDIAKGIYNWNDGKTSVNSKKMSDISTLSWLWPILGVDAAKSNIAAFAAGNPVDCSGDCEGLVPEHVWIFLVDAQGFVHHVIVRNYADAAKRVYRDIKFEI